MRALVVTNMYPTAANPHAGTFVQAQVESLQRLGVEIDVLHLPRHESGRRVYRQLAAKVRRRVAAGGPDLVHVAYGGVMAATVTRAVLDRPVLITFHGSDLLGGGGKTWADGLSRRFNVLASHRAARRAAGVIVVSERLRAALPASVDRARVWVVPNGVDLERFRPLDRTRCQEALGWDTGAPHVLFPASPARPEKRYELAQAAVRRLQDAGVGVRLHALDRVPYEDVPVWLNASDAVVMTSAHEGSPVVVKEALACNVPVVSVDVGDVRERIAEVDGCFIADATPDDVAEKLAAALARQRRIDGRSRVTELSLERVGSRARAIYGLVAAGDHRSNGDV